MHTHMYVYMPLYYFMKKHKGVDENTSRWQYWMGGEKVVGAMGAGKKEKGKGEGHSHSSLISCLFNPEIYKCKLWVTGFFL